MSAFEVTDKLVAAIASGKYDAIVCNYANGDMVGHTGNLDAAMQGGRRRSTPASAASSTPRARRAARSLITADHGNAEHDARRRDRASRTPRTR